MGRTIRNFSGVNQSGCTAVEVQLHEQRIFAVRVVAAAGTAIRETEGAVKMNSTKIADANFENRPMDPLGTNDFKDGGQQAASNPAAAIAQGGRDILNLDLAADRPPAKEAGNLFPFDTDPEARMGGGHFVAKDLF